MKKESRTAATKLRKERPEIGQPWFDWQGKVEAALGKVSSEDEAEFLDAVYEDVEPRP